MQRAPVTIGGGDTRSSTRSFSEAIEPRLFTSDEIAARRSIHTELDNLRAAVSWALDRDDRDDNELGVRIAAAFSTEGAMGRASGVSEWAARCLPFVETTTPARRFQILTCVAWNAHSEARMDECADICVAIMAEPIPNDVYYCCGAHLCFAGAHTMRGDVDAAVAVSYEGIALAESRGTADVFIAFALAVVAMHQLANGRFEPGRRDAERAVEMARRSRNPSALVLATYALGWSLSQDDPAAAEVALTDTIELCEAGAIDAVLAPAWCLRAVLWLDAGRYDDAVLDIRPRVRAIGRNRRRPDHRRGGPSCGRGLGGWRVCRRGRGDARSHRGRRHLQFRWVGIRDVEHRSCPGPS